MIESFKNFLVICGNSSKKYDILNVARLTCCRQPWYFYKLLLLLIPFETCRKKVGNYPENKKYINIILAICYEHFDFQPHDWKPRSKFLSATWLPHDQLRSAVEGTTSLTQCKSLYFYSSFNMRPLRWGKVLTGGLLMSLDPNVQSRSNH